ncbi:OprD family outer membrane porin [Sulfurospirillum sp. UCH001]|uniref:OprD family outer membrane porin n=1 Tax=Sulfurospirillum sp. UCH001 TaxID=1581011 RepID=UPI00082F26EE|nr:OprD family outer membrane porin [Sulfurospirillum sp. UCH001]
MQFVKLSLVAVVVASLASHTFAADTLADAFKNGKASGELRAWYFDKDTEKLNSSTAPTSVVKDTTKSGDILNTALILNYVTDTFYGFNVGATMQANAAPFVDEEGKEAYKDDMWGSGAVLSEAYLGYTIGKTNAKIGRQFISTPIVNGSGSRIVKESFEGATIVNTDVPSTTLIAGYVDKFQGRTSTGMGSSDGDAPTFEKRAIFLGVSASTTYAFDDAYTVAIINKSIPNLTLTGQYAWAGDVNKADDVDVYYTEANYVLPMNGFKLGFDANFRGSKTDLVTGTGVNAVSYDGTQTAGRISISELAGFGAAFTAATNSKDDAVIAGMGNGASSYTATLVKASSPSLRANTDSYRFDLTYDFSKLGVTGLKSILQYALANQDRVKSAQTSADYTSYAAGISYAVPALKGLSLELQYEKQEIETTRYSNNTKFTADLDELRFKANYKF